MEDAADRFRRLLAEGQGFTYESFATKGTLGYPEALSPEWLSWTGRVQMAVNSVFGTESPIGGMLELGVTARVLGNGPEEYNRAKGHIVGALQTSIDALEQGFAQRAARLATPDLATGKVFVVHGHDNALKTELEVFLKGVGLDPVVLHRQPDEGATLLEKFEKHADVGYAFVLLTPDDIAYPRDEMDKPESARSVEERVRQNVIFEFGFFVGRLGRSRVCCLFKEGVTLPSDLNGLVYKKVDGGIEEIGFALLKELKAAGYAVVL